MDHPMHIPWTRTNKLRNTTTTPEVRKPDFFQRLTEFLVRTLAPFPEAREALCLALVNFETNSGMVGT